MITGGDLRQSRLDVGYKTFTISPWGSDVLGAVLFVFIVLLVTDILGLTKVFPFTRSVR